MASWSTIWTGISAVAAVGTGVAVVLLALQANDLADTAHGQLVQQQQSQSASRIYLGDVPPDSDLGRAHKAGEPAVLAVLNASYIEATQVWVVGHMRDDPRVTGVLVFHSIPSCSLYSIQDNFIPDALHFTDGNGHWKREIGGVLALGDNQKMPTNPRRLDPAAKRSGIDNTIPNCTR